VHDDIGFFETEICVYQVIFIHNDGVELVINWAEGLEALFREKEPCILKSEKLRENLLDFLLKTS
jgi:hypothetical protein